MSRKTLFLVLVAAMPASLGAQEFRVTNCRTLEAAGNFVGPDEVIMNDLVCTKLKPGAEAVKSEAPKPIPGVVISDTDSTTVVDAAKAASKRTAAAKEAIKQTAEQNQKEANPATDETPDTSAPPAGNPEVPAPPAEPAKTSPAAKPPATAPPPAARPPFNVIPQKPGPEVAAAPEPAQEPAPRPEAAPRATSPEPTETAAAPVEPAQNSGSSATEVAPSPAPAPPTENATRVPVPPTEAAATPDVPASTAASPAEPSPTSVSEVRSAPPAQPEQVTGFDDANRGAQVVTNPRPEDSLKIETPTPPPAKTPAEVAAEAAAARNAAEAEAALLAPDPNLPRERVVAMGAFVKPREEGPDPTAEARKTTFLPGDTEGFEEGHRPECTKNITLGGLKGEKLVLGTPDWAERWIEKNQKRIPQVCFSDMPIRGAKNYLIVFYTAAANKNGPEAQKPGNSSTPPETPAGGVGAFTLSYGSTWHYAVDRTVGVTVLTRDEADQPYSQPGQVRYATAYTEEGMPLVEHWPEQPKKEIHPDANKPNSKKSREARAELEHVSGDLLGQIVDDLAKM